MLLKASLVSVCGGVLVPRHATYFDTQASLFHCGNTKKMLEFWSLVCSNLPFQGKIAPNGALAQPVRATES